MVVLTVSGKRQSMSTIVRSAVFGALTGASIGFSFDSPHDGSIIGKRYLCRRCFRTFSYFEHTVS